MTEQYIAHIDNDTNFDCAMSAMREALERIVALERGGLAEARRIAREALVAAPEPRSRVLICGSRDWTDWLAVRRRVDQLADDALVIHGDAFGPDGERERYNTMLDLQPDLVIVFQRGGDSPGIQHTIDEATRRGIPVEVHRAYS